MALALVSLPALANDFTPFSTDSRIGQMLFGVLAGVLSTAACYLLFIWMAIRDRSQIFLIIMLLALLANLGMSTDLGMSAMGIQETLMLKFMQLASLITFYVASCIFTLYFLELSTYSRFYQRLIIGVIGLLGIVFLLGAFSTIVVSGWINVVGAIVCSVLIMAGLQALSHGVPGANTHVLAFGLLIAGALNQPLAQLGINALTLQGINLFYFASGAAALVFAIGIARQFSSRQEEKERLLSLSNERFALAALGSNEGLFDWDIENKRAYFSDRFKKMIGRDLDPTSEGVEQWMAAIDPSQQDRIRQDLKGFLRGDSITMSFEYRAKRADGQLRWLQTTAVPLRDARGNARRLVGSTGDITERKQAEVALRDSESRFRSIIEAHPVPVVIIALDDFTFMYASPSVSDLLHVPASQLLNHSAQNYFVEANALPSLSKELIGANHVEGREVIMRRPDGSVIAAALSARMLEFQRRSAAVIGLNDLTERQEAQAQIEQQRIALEQSEKLAALGSLLAGVAHELNNPLSVVVGQSSLLLEGSSDPKIQTRADKIRKAAERCTRIVRNFLALARRKDPERKTVELNHVINQAFELLAPQLRSDTVDVKLELAEGLPTVMGDADQLNQIITNLVLNAKHALTDQPLPRTVTIATSAQMESNSVVMKVSDNGPGVPPDVQRRMFEPFFTTKTEGRGTGIGLSLSLGLAEAHGGRLTYEDTPGGGATFILSLPIGAAEAEAPVKAAEPLVKLPPMKVLVVDDEPDVMQILTDLLTNDGHQITQAEDGARAIEQLQKQSFDLIVSDLRMPVMDGPTLYRTIKSEIPHYVNRIFFVTGDTLSAHVRTFLEENPVLVIDKPYMADDVRQAVQRQLKIAGHAF